MKRLVVLCIALAAFATACQGNVFSLSVGDCFNDPDDFNQVSDVEIVDCDESHDTEVFATYEIPGSTFPGVAALGDNAEDNCIARFKPYVGADYMDSSLNVSYFYPTDASWEQGDREIICVLYDRSYNKLTASVKGTGV